jgi:hypothetical protein
MHELVGRARLASLLGRSYGTDRNLYEALGYKTELEYEDYATQYLRQAIAKAIINRPVKATWRGDITLLESNDENETLLEADWKELDRKHRLKSKFIRVDKLTQLGKYGVLLLGLSDVKNRDDYMKPVQTSVKLNYIKPLGEKHAEIQSWESRSNNPRFGLPVYYNVTIYNPGQKTSTILRVHHSRIIHITGELLESEVEGVPALQAVFNRLKDLEKLVGGSAEMFWRGARPGYSNELKEGYQSTTQTEDQLRQQLDEYEHNLRRFITLEGLELKELKPQVSDPKSHVEVQLQMIAAERGIPLRILLGSERGELASSQDRNNWFEEIQTRREEFAEPQIIRPVVERFIQMGILRPPKQEGEYSVEWMSLFKTGEKEQAEIASNLSSALKSYGTAPGLEMIFPTEAFMKYVLKFTDEQIEYVNELRGSMITEEEEEMRGADDDMDDGSNQNMEEE